MTLPKVKVPKEAVVSQRALEAYLFSKQEEECADLVLLSEPNIWDSDDQYEYGGTFRFA